MIKISDYSSLESETKKILYPRVTNGISLLRGIVLSWVLWTIWFHLYDTHMEQTLPERQINTIFHNGIIRAKILGCISSMKMGSDALKIYNYSKDNVQYVCGSISIRSSKLFTPKELRTMHFPPGTILEDTTNGNNTRDIIRKIPTK